MREMAWGEEGKTYRGEGGSETGLRGGGLLVRFAPAPPISAAPFGVLWLSSLIGANVVITWIFRLDVCARFGAGLMILP